MAHISLNTPYIVVTGAVVAAVAFLFLYIQPALEQIRGLRQDITQQESVLRERRVFLATIEKNLDSLRRNDQHERRLATILPERENTKDAIRILHQSEQASGVVIETIGNASAGAQARASALRARGNQEALSDNLQITAFNLRVEGSYQQIRAFLQELEKSPRLMDVVSINLSGGADNLQAGITIHLYSQAASNL